MNGICVAKEVVHVAQNFLIRTYEEHTNVVVFAILHRVKRNVVRLLVVIDIRTDFTVRVTGNILNGSATRGTLIQTRNRHDGEELVNPPRVGHRLEEREVAEVFVGHLLIQLAQFFGSMLLMVHQFRYFTRNRPVETLNLCTRFEVDNAVAEEVERFFADVFRIVPVFKHRA